MVWTELAPDPLSVVPGLGDVGAAIVIFVADPATTAGEVVVADQEPIIVPIDEVLATDLPAAGCDLVTEHRPCAGHGPSPRIKGRPSQLAKHRGDGRVNRSLFDPLTILNPVKAIWPHHLTLVAFLLTCPVISGKQNQRWR